MTKWSLIAKILALAAVMLCTSILADPGTEMETPDRDLMMQVLEELEPTNQWLGTLGQHLAFGIEDPWVNVFATSVQLPGFSLTVEQRDAIWMKARNASWDDPAVLWQLWAAQCLPYDFIEARSTEASCGDPELEARLRELEPDNAAVLVLGIQDTSNEAADLLSLENRQLLDAAGQLPTFSTWSLAGADRLYEVISQFVATNPPPDGFFADPFNATVFDLFVLTLVSDSGSAIRGTSRFFASCRTAFQLDEQDVVRSCRSLIEAIKHTARSEVTLALASELEYGFDVGYDAHGKPLGWAEETRRQSDLRSCRATRFLENAVGEVNREEDAQRLAAEIATLGPRRAWHYAAIRDFSVHPDRYETDPANCERAFPRKDQTAGP